MIVSTKRLLQTASVIALALALSATNAMAQDAAPPPAGVISAPEGDIIITARRKEESAQTVPISVQVINSELLAAKGIQTTNDLQKLVPGVILNGAGSMSNSTYTIRGQGKNVTGPGLPSVITYVNEIPLPSIGSFAPTFDLDNVQVLKGPQGTLFGRNTTGGAVLVYTKTPTYDFGGYVQGDVGNFGKHAFQGAINVPLIEDKLAIRAAASIDRRDGYTDNVSTGQDQDDVHSDAFRLSVLFEPTATLKNVLVLDYMTSDTNSLGFYPFEPLTPGVTAAVAALQTRGDRTIESSIRPFDKETFWGVTNTTTANLGAVTFKNIFGYRYTKVSNYQNATGLANTPLPDLGPFLSSIGYVPGEPGTLITTRNVSITRQYSDEMQLSGTAFEGSASWLLGAFWLDQGPAGQDYLTLDIFRPTSPSPTLVANANNFFGGIWPVGSQVNTMYVDKSKALFGNVSLDVGKWIKPLEGLTFNAGYRYTWDEESVCSNGSTSTLLSDGTSIFKPFEGFSDCKAFAGNALSAPSFYGVGKFEAPTYTIGLDYKLNDDVFVYFTTRSGYRAGGLNGPTLAPALAQFQTFDPQKVTDYEVGLHTKWQSGDWRGRFNIAAFTGEFTDIQLQATGITANSGIPGVDASNAPSNTALTINAGSSRAEGVEIDGSISPFQGLNVSFAAAYLTQEYIEQVAPAVLAPFFQSSQGFTGVPEWSYQVGVDYDLPLDPAIGTVTLHASHYYLDEQFQGPALLPAYELTDFSVDWANIFGKPITATAYIDNAFDEKYVQNVILSTPSFGTYTGNYAAPQMYGVRLRYNF
jgi:iron complex outermembrane recepter protein